MKCARQVSALGRLSKKLSVPCKMKILEAFVLSNFSYFSTLYHFCNVTDSRKMEKLYERALRYVYLDFESTYLMLLRKCNKSSLYLTRIRELLLAVFKIRTDMMPPIDSDIFKVQISPYDMGYIHLKTKTFNTVRYGFKSLQHHGAMYFNTLNLTRDFDNILTET